MACEAHSKVVPIVHGDTAGCLMQSRLVPSVIDVYVRGEDHTLPMVKITVFPQVFPLHHRPALSPPFDEGGLFSLGYFC